MEISWIEAGLLAASGAPVNLEHLQSLHQQGIRAIVTLTEYPLTSRQEITPQVLAELGITAFHAPVIDHHAPDVATAERVITFINQMKATQKPVLLHCAAGIGRTGTLLHAYYLSQGLSLAEAKARVKTSRPVSQYLMLSDSQKAFIKQYASA